MTTVRRWLAAALLASATVPAGAVAVTSVPPPATTAQIAAAAPPTAAVGPVPADAPTQATAAPAIEANRTNRTNGLNRTDRTNGANDANERLSSAAAPILIVDVNLIRMHDDRIEPARAVLVRGGRIAAIGARADLAVPANATVIDGAGRYLLPGLTDAHVHLTTDMPWAPARSDFGDAPLYLAHGVTSVINLRGTPEQLDWRRRIEAGTMLGPTIYSSGEFVNEPRVRTPEEVTREVAAQRQAGYDLIKFHEIWTPDAGYLTTSGLSRPAYRAMNDAAQRLEMPLVGHAAPHLGLEALLESRQSLAHVGALSNLHFLPLASEMPRLRLIAAAYVLLTLAALVAAGGALSARRRGGKASEGDERLSDRGHALEPAGDRARERGLPHDESARGERSRGRWIRGGWRGARTTLATWLACTLALVCAVAVLPGGPLSDRDLLRGALTVLSLAAALAAIAQAIAVVAAARWRLPANGQLYIAHAGALLSALAGLTLAFQLVTFGVPLAWRSSSAGIASVSQRLHERGVWVQTTLVNYDFGSPDQRALVDDPAARALSPLTRDTWGAIPVSEQIGYGYHRFTRRLAGALHRAGVPLMAGTDAMGMPFLVPGSALHRELALLVDSGLTPYEAIRAATVNPARFLRRERDFGTIDVGSRADLLLVDGNPLRDLAVLRTPAGVMVRGRWLPRDELQRMLDALAAER